MKNVLYIATVAWWTLIFAQDDQYFLRMVKEDQIEKKLLSSSTFKDCANLKLADKVSACIFDKVSKLDKGKAEQLLNALNLGQTELYGDPNQKNLSKYLSELVKKAIHGSNMNDASAMNNLDQEMFTSVYERIVGKALFLEISQFCLTQKNTALNGEVKIDAIVEKLGADTDNFVKTCLNSIKKSCEIKNGTVNDPSACLFNRRLVEYKSLLSKLKEDKTFWATVRDDSQNLLKLESLDKNIGKSNNEIANELSNINSSMIVDEGYQEKNKVLSNQAKAMMDECLKNKTDENCKKFFNKGTKESLGELRLQKELELELKIKQLKDSSIEDLKKTAKASNYFSDDELKNMLNADAETIKKAIEDKYLAEKMAIHKDIEDKINAIGIDKEGDLAASATQLGNIHKILENKPDEIRAVNFFSNVIVATFSFKGDKDGKKRIFSGIDNELKALQSQTSNPDTQQAITYLNNMKGNGRTAASADENHFLEPEEIDYILFGD